MKSYLQLNLVLLYCYLCKILINRLAIRAHSVHVVSMPAISMLPPIFAIDFCRRSSMPEIGPCSWVPIWILLLGICSLRTPANCKWNGEREKSDHKLVYLWDFMHIFIQFRIYANRFTVAAAGDTNSQHTNLHETRKWNKKTNYSLAVRQWDKKKHASRKSTVATVAVMK